MLSLPEDAERHLPSDGTFDWLRGPAVYCLSLSVPDEMGDVWDGRFDSRPDWFDEFASAERAVYVGSSMDVLSRLEDHKDGEKRLTVLTDVCEVESLRNCWYFPSITESDELRFEERKLARWLRDERPTWFVRQA